MNNIHAPEKEPSNSALGLRPLGPFVIVRPVEAQHKTASGILLPSPENKNHRTGIVEAIGPGELQNGKYIPIEGVSPGDMVLFDELSADDLPHNGQNLLVLKQSALIAVYK